ncbi:MAG: FAD-binding oxidoreductase [Thermoleophilia bacterium]
MTRLAPRSRQELASALAAAAARGAPVAVEGGGTRSRRGWPGPRPEHVVSTEGLRRVIAHEPADLTVTVEAGLPAADLAALAASAGQAWPQAEIRPGSTVGGVLSAAASGRGRLRAGAVRDSLLQVVLATGDGRLVTAGGRTVKGVAGFDIPRLAVGALGTLGVIVEVTLKLWPLPAARGWFGADGPLDERLAIAARALAGPARPSCVLLRPGAVAVELVGPREDVAAPDGTVALAGEPAAPRGRGIVEASVAPPRLGALAAALEDAGLDYEARMGVGTCHVAVETAGDVDAVRALAVSAGGHAQVIDAPDELRADPWGPPSPGLHLMRRMRDAFDPAGILNPSMLVWRHEAVVA